MELDGYGPMEIRINDRALLLDILQVAVIDQRFEVNSYNAKTQQRLQKVLDT